MGLQTANFSFYSHMMEGVSELSGVPFMKTVILLMGVPSSQTNHLPKAPCPNIFTFGVRISKY